MAEQIPIQTGKDVASLCTKCGDVWHVVVAMVGSQIAKVQCKECGAYHRFRDPRGKVKSPRKTTPRKKAAGKTSGPVVDPHQAAVEADLSKPPQTYSAREHFEVGQRVQHPKFGDGVVELSESGKATVFFASGRRVLAQARAEAKLARPQRFSFGDEE